VISFDFNIFTFYIVKIYVGILAINIFDHISSAIPSPGITTMNTSP